MYIYIYLVYQEALGIKAGIDTQPCSRTAGTIFLQLASTSAELNIHGSELQIKPAISRVHLEVHLSPCLVLPVCPCVM